ncbi:MAG: glycosyltransferase family 4 protein [Candidatus Omnitrophota bacterium]|jgi:glycosyltransferase involved in cell wall biosynthesis
MKVLFFTREDKNLSGARLRCYGLSSELNKTGIYSEVFSFAEDLGAKCAERESEMGLGTKLNYNLRAFCSLRKKIDSDTVIFMQRLNYHTLAPFLISWLGKRKFIFDCDDWNIREDPVYRFGFYPSSKMEYFTGRLAGYAHACIASSVFLKEYLSRFSKNVHYLPTGVDTRLFRPPEADKKSSQLVFSWIGTAYHAPMGENLKFLIDIFSSLMQKHSNIFLSFAGEGKYFNAVMGQLGNFKYKDRVINEGWIPPQKIPDYLSRIDVGLLPLIQNTKFNIAKSPTKLFEYMSMAKPTVSSDIGEAPRIIQDNKNGFLAGDREEFIAKIERLINEPALRNQMGVAARESIEEKYSLSVLGKELAEIIRKI